MPIDLNRTHGQIVDVGSRALVATQLHLQRDRPCQALSVAEQCGSFAQQLLEGSSGATCPACSLTCPDTAEPGWYIAGGFGGGFFVALTGTLIGQCLARRTQPAVPQTYSVPLPADSDSRGILWQTLGHRRPLHEAQAENSLSRARLPARHSTLPSLIALLC